MRELLKGIFECLDINSNTGLATEDSLPEMSPFQRLFYTQVHEKLGIDAVYFLRDANGIAKIPLIYFSAIQKYDATKVAELHRLSWNLGEAPLLFVVTPDEVLIYNNYEAPQALEAGNLDPTAGIIETLSLTDGLASQRLALQKYHRSLLESGEYWRQNETRFDIQGRVDTTLMSNLRIMRKTLISQISKRCNESKETITSIVHSLLSRSIFIKYLEERKDSNGATVFPQGFYSGFLESAKCYAYFTANSLIEIDDMHMEARYVKALCLIRFDKFPEAGNLLNDLIEEDSQNKARYYYALGRIQKRQTEYVRAIELFEMSVCEKPRYLSPYREMAECYILMDNCQEAERCISKAHEIDDSNIFVILLEARLAQKQGRPDYAIDLLNSATTLNQESAQIFFRKGRALDQLGNSIEACQCYKESLQHNPKMYDAELCLLSHQLLSDPENAKKRIDQLKPKLHGKRKAVLQNIEARLIGYTKQHENDALELLSSVDCQYRDRQWFAVRIQLLENLYKKHQVAGRTIIANKFLDDMLNAKKEFREKYGADTLIEQDFLPDS